MDNRNVEAKISERSQIMKKIYKDDIILMEDSHVRLAEKSPSNIRLDTQANPVMLQQMFERTVDATPDQIAVIYESKEYSYRDLDHHANRIARHLRSSGVQARDRVGILLNRSIETYASIIAVLKLGATYVPLDISYPIDRINFIIDDADITLLISTESVVAQKDEINCPQVLLDREKKVIAALRDSRPDIALPGHPENEVCYIIYTSGSTGRPKGVEIEHRSIVNFLNVVTDVYGFRPEDRVFQGMSIAFDFSFEEIWTTFKAGATLVATPVGECSLIGGELSRFLVDQHVTVLVTVPTLLSSIEEDIPSLRLINIGGEAVPQHLVELWARPGRRILNTYGPTETTVTATWAEMEPGKPVTIGKPLPSYMVFIADEAGQQVPHGEIGEIYIGGIGVARGYVKRPDLTTKCFIPDPDAEQGSNARFYRTGDLGRYTEEGEIEYHGRADLQVKLRGYRIELSEIESVMMKSEDVQAAAVAVVAMPNGIDELVAYVIPKLGHNIDKAQLHDLLQEYLPHYMVPAYIEPINEFPVLTSGKIDRKSLPKPGLTRLGSNKPFVAPNGKIENLMSEIWKNVLRLDKISATDNFFLDLGGYSLLAAQTISALRKHPEMSFLNLTDLYKNPTIEQLAGMVASHRSNHSNTVKAQSSADPKVVPPEQTDKNAFKVSVAQSLWLTAELLVGSALAYLGLFWFIPWLSNLPMVSNLPWPSSWIGWVGLIVLFILLEPFLLTAVSIASLPLSVAIAVGAKRILIGKYTPTRAPVWSGFYFRMWMVRQFMRFIPWETIAGTEFQCMALRALGARIGKRVHIHRGVNLQQGGWDLLDIGDDVTISQDAVVSLVDLDKGQQVVVGPITLEDGVTLDVNAGVEPNTRVGHHAWLTALSWLTEGGTIPPGEKWDGVPAQSVGTAPKPPLLTDDGKQLSPLVHGTAMILCQDFISMTRTLPYTLGLFLLYIHFYSLDSLLTYVGHTAVAYNAFLDSFGHPAEYMTLFVTIGLLICLVEVGMLAFDAVVVRALGPVHPGVISKWSLAYIRVWLKTGLLASVDRMLSGTRFFPVWLRAAGMKVDHKCEIGMIIDVVPELVQINEGTFLADINYLGGPRIQQGTVTLANTLLDRDTFMGNHVVVPAGQQLPPDILIGVGTVADDQIIKPGSSWFGHPPFDLITREAVTADRSLTFDPTFALVVTRAFWEWLRFFLPLLPSLGIMFWLFGVIYAKTTMPLWALLGFGIPAVSLASGALLLLINLGMKWGVLGRQRDGSHPLYSCWASRWDFLTLLYDATAANILRPLEGTLFVAPYFRLLGSKIGKRAVLSEGFAGIIVDHDMLYIGNYTTVNAHFQAHTFEGRVLKTGHIRMEDYSTLKTNSIALYGTTIGEHTFVAPGSVIMKGETLPSWTSWEGNPAQLSDEEMVLSNPFKEEGSKVGSPSPLMKGETLPTWTSWEGNPSKLGTIHSVQNKSIDTDSSVIKAQN